MRSAPPAVAIACLALLGGAACDVTIRDGDVSINQLHGRATREWSREYPLEAGGGVEVINSNGSIEVSARPAGTFVAAVVITARAMTDDRANELLNGVKIDEVVSREHVKLTTVRGRQRGNVRVDYKLTVPRDAPVELTANNGNLKAAGLQSHVKAMVVNGALELTDLKGTVDAASVNGSMSVRISEVTGRIRLEGTNGRISLELPKHASAVLSARAVNGGVTVTGLPTQDSSGRRIRNVESVLNGGGPEIDVRITNGRISITGR